MTLAGSEKPAVPANPPIHPLDFLLKILSYLKLSNPRRVKGWGWRNLICSISRRNHPRLWQVWCLKNKRLNMVAGTVGLTEQPEEVWISWLPGPWEESWLGRQREVIGNSVPALFSLNFSVWNPAALIIFSRWCVVAVVGFYAFVFWGSVSCTPGWAQTGRGPRITLNFWSPASACQVLGLRVYSQCFCSVLFLYTCLTWWYWWSCCLSQIWSVLTDNSKRLLQHIFSVQTNWYRVLALSLTPYQIHQESCTRWEEIFLHPWNWWPCVVHHPGAFLQRPSHGSGHRLYCLLLIRIFKLTVRYLMRAFADVTERNVFSWTSQPRSLSQFSDRPEPRLQWRLVKELG